ncbi:TPA: FUSC family protein [Legionella feeleii]
MITPKTIENRAALRTAIATVVAVLIAFMLHLDKPYWAGMTVVILANLYTGSIIDKAILRILGTVFGVWLGFFFAGFVANSLFLYLLMNFMLVAIGVYYYNFSSHAYAYLLGAIGAFLVIAQLAMAPQEAFFVAVWRPIEIGLGVLVSAAAAFCLFPNNISEHALKDIDAIFTELGNVLESLKTNLLTGELDFTEIKNSNLQLKRKLKKSTEIIDFMRRELGVKKEKIDQIRVLIDLFLNLSRTISFFISSYEREVGREWAADLYQPVAEVFTAVQHDLDVLRKAFFSLAENDRTIQIDGAMEALKQTITSETDESLVKIKHYYQIEPLLQQINTVITSLSTILISGQNLEVKEERLISFKQQLRHDPDIIKHSIKAGLAAVLALSFWLVSNWPGGLNGIISSIVISIRRNLFDMKNISFHRILGCLSGGGVALFPLAFFSMNLYDLILVLFFAVWGFSYFAFKYTKYAYIGLQANIALVISLAQAGGPPTDLAPPLERLGGIFIGITASFLVANILWRTDLLSMAFGHVRKLFRYVRYNMIELLSVKKEKEKLYDLANLFWVSRGLLESFNEEQLSPKKQKKLIEAKRKFAQLALIQATISLIHRSIDQEKAHNTAVSLGINLDTLEQMVKTLYDTKQPDKRQMFKSQIEAQLAQIEPVIYSVKATDIDLDNCIAYVNALTQLAMLRIDL